MKKEKGARKKRCTAMARGVPLDWEPVEYLLDRVRKDEISKAGDFTDGGDAAQLDLVYTASAITSLAEIIEHGS